MDLNSIPATIGGYRIERILKQGNLSVTTLASATEKDHSVIKVLPLEAVRNQSAFARFKSEIQAIQQLVQPNLLQIKQWIEQNGYLYLVMPYLAGGSLQERLAEGALPPDEVSRIVNCLARVLYATHAVGVVHGDLKPANILFDERAEPYLADFGMASFYQACDPPSFDISEGKTEIIHKDWTHAQAERTKSIDIYQLGILTFQMLSGKLPDGLNTPQFDIHKEETNLTPETIQLLARATTTIPEEQFLDCNEFTKALVQNLAGSGATGTTQPQAYPQTPPVDPTYQLTPTAANQAIKHRRGGAWLAALVLLVILAIFSAAYFILIPGLDLTALKSQETAQDISTTIPGTPTGQEQGKDTPQAWQPASTPIPEQPVGELLQGLVTTTPTAMLPSSPISELIVSETPLLNLPFPEVTPLVITYVKFEGNDDLFSIAGRFNIDLNYLLGANNLKCEGRPTPGVPLFIPPAGIRQLPQISTAIRLDNVDFLTPLHVLDCMKNVRDVEFSPDGKTLAAALGKDIYLWRVQDWVPLTEKLDGHLAVVTSVGFSPDGEQLISGAEDGTIILWSLKDYSIINNEPHAHQNAVTDVTFSPDGRSIVSTSLDQNVKIWPLPDMNYPKPIQGYAATCAVFSPDKQLLAVCYPDRVSLYSANNYQFVRDLKTKGIVYEFAFSPDGILAASNADLWQVQEGQHIYDLTNSSAQVRFSTDSQLVFIGKAVYRASDGSWYKNLTSPVTPSSSSSLDYDRVIFNPEGTLFAWADRDSLSIWSVQGVTESVEVESGQTHVVQPEDSYFNLAKQYDVKLSSLLEINRNPPCHTIYNGKTLQIPTTDITPVQISSTPITPSTVGQFEKLFTLDDTCARDLGEIVFSPDGELIASGANLWQISRDSILVQEPSPAYNQAYADGIIKPAPVILVSPDGKTVAVRSQQNVKLYDANTGRLIRPLSTDGPRIAGMAFSPDSKLIATGTGVDERLAETICIWRVEDGELLHDLPGYAGKNLQFTPDGTRLLVAWEDETLRFYNLLERKWEEQLDGMEGAYDLSPDGKKIVYIGCEEKIKDLCIKDLAIVYNLETGLRENTFRGWSDAIEDVVFGTEGKSIFVASSFTVVKWDLETDTDILHLDPGPQDRVLVKELFMTPDRSLLITITEKDRLQFWDVNSGAVLNTKRLDFDNMAFSPDMTRVGFLSNENVEIWGIP